MDVLELLQQDNDVRVDDGGTTGGPDYNLGKEFSRRARWSTRDPQQPFLTVTVTGYVTGEIQDRDGLKISDLSWGETFHEGEKITYPSGYDADTTWVKYYALGEVEAIGHTEEDDPGGSEAFCKPSNVLRDASVGLGVPCDSVAEAEAAARKFVEGYAFDPAQVSTY